MKVGTGTDVVGHEEKVRFSGDVKGLTLTAMLVLASPAFSTSPSSGIAEGTGDNCIVLSEEEIVFDCAWCSM